MTTMDTRPMSPGERSRGFSFHSHRSDKSGGSRPKEDLVESPKDKARRDRIWTGNSKANPNAAMTELQPAVKAILEESTLQPLRGVQHKDVNGNVITDPDLSNPTRPRLERPLDTIRSFEKAIDNGYRRRSSYNRSESYGNSAESQYAGSRRNSGYGFDGYNQNRNTNHNGGYYGGSRPDSYAAGPSGNRRYPASRMNSEPMMYGNGQRPYPHAHQNSQDTMHTGVTNGSDSDRTGPWANSTDPSSENSSVERGPTANGYHPGHASNGFRDGIPEDGAYQMRGGAPPVQPPHGARRPIALGNSDGIPATPASLPSTKRSEPEKRKSWIKRAFSRND